MKAKVFEIKNATIQEDSTAYGNKFWIQCEDTNEENHSFLREVKGRKAKIILIVEEEK